MTEQEMHRVAANYAAGNGQVSNGRATAINDIAPIQAHLSKRKVRDINIRQLDHGYVVEIGCQVFAVESASTLIAKFSEYILSPSETEEKWAEGKLF